jgi:hypothetical protein
MKPAFSNNEKVFQIGAIEESILFESITEQKTKA